MFLYHSRLKIIDINPRSNQPFTDKDEKYYLLFNGEIYNYLELQKKYKIKINTSSDTEILFLLLKNHGLKKTLREIKGMFSFVFFDTEKNIIFCARDHFGQKPLYYTNKSHFSCSTSIKPLANFEKKVTFDKECIDFYLNSSGILPIDKTLYKNIYSLPAGKYLKYNLNTKKIIIQEYFHPSDLISKKNYKHLNKFNSLSLEKKLRSKIYRAVKNCSISDVKVGTLLSGGIDSSLVTYYAKKINSKITSFTGISEGIENIPKKIVPKIVKQIKLTDPIFVNHRPEDYLEKLFQLITRNYSPSRWGGGVPMSNICKVAKKKEIKVLLSGDAVDEICGGYKTFSEINVKSNKSYHKIINVKSKNENKLIINYENFLRKNRKKINNKLSFIKSFNERNKQLFFLEDTSIFLQSCTLPHGDEYSMHESIELRNPYLDLELVNFLVNLKSKFKSKTVNTKIMEKLFLKILLKKFLVKK